ncbi:hypothetical protein AN477_22005 [Alicyclobacillus ferrooxydans]|uniref:Uncharacterized protein n=1 Tax=Alicyclobacillus ferrooxydans TaxID=471514 RepID=A0A0P9ECB6_9BACL|nr:hypothetical protein AN477_22005 [Alicyclobacillus ferrooxydans]
MEHEQGVSWKIEQGITWNMSRISGEHEQDIRWNMSRVSRDGEEKMFVDSRLRVNERVTTNKMSFVQPQSAQIACRRGHKGILVL